MSEWETRLAVRSGWANLPATIRGAIWTLLAGLTFSFMGVMVKLMGDRLDSFQIAFFRAGFGLVCILPFAIAAGPSVLATRRPLLHLIRGSVGMVGMFGGFYSLTHLPLAYAAALSFTKPLFLTILASILLSEKVRLRRISATVIGFGGVLIILRPGSEISTINFFASAVALFAAFSVALVVVSVKKLVETERPVTVMLYFGLISTTLALGPALYVWRSPTVSEWGALIAIGALGASAQSLMIRGYQSAEAMSVASLDYARIVYAGLFGYFIFGELPDRWTLLGTAVIVLSSFYIIRREHQLGKRRSAPILDQAPIKPADIAPTARQPGNARPHDADD